MADQAGQGTGSRAVRRSHRRKSSMNRDGTPVQYGGTALGWWKHRECNRSYFFTSAEGLPLHPERKDIAKWWPWCRHDGGDWDQLPGHVVMEPLEHWRQ